MLLEINPKLKFYIMKRKQQKKQGMLFYLILFFLSLVFIYFILEQERLHQEKECKQVLIELNELKERISTLKKELSNYEERRKIN